MSTELEWVERLANSVTWKNGAETDEAIAEMDLWRCDNLICWLQSKARAIEREYCAQTFLVELEPYLPEDDRDLNRQKRISHWEAVPELAPTFWREIRSLPTYQNRSRHCISWLNNTPLLRALLDRRSLLRMELQEAREREGWTPWQPPLRCPHCEGLI